MPTFTLNGVCCCFVCSVYTEMISRYASSSMISCHLYLCKFSFLFIDIHDMIWTMLYSIIANKRPRCININYRRLPLPPRHRSFFPCVRVSKQISNERTTGFTFYTISKHRWWATVAYRTVRSIQWYTYWETAPRLRPNKRQNVEIKKCTEIKVDLCL